MTDHPTPEQVAVAWLKTVDGVDSTKVATALPADASVWAATGFWQVTVVGGEANTYAPMWSPVVRVDCWAANLNSQSPPWGRAGSYAAAVSYGCHAEGAQVGALPLAGFHTPRVMTVRPISIARRVPDDEAGFARVQLDVQLAYTVVVT